MSTKIRTGRDSAVKRFVPLPPKDSPFRAATRSVVTVNRKALEVLKNR